MSSLPICVGWKVLVEPKIGKTMTASGIDISATADAEEHLVYCGKIVAIGEAAFTARTKGGINMDEWKVRPQLNDYVIFTPYGGLQIRRVGEKEIPLRLMNDTDIHALIESPEDYYSWIDA